MTKALLVSKELHEALMNHPLIIEYKRKKEEYLSNEIVSKYLSLKEEVNNLLNTLQEIINDNL